MMHEWECREPSSRSNTCDNTKNTSFLTVVTVPNTLASGYRHFRVRSLCLAFVDYLGSKKLVCQGSNATMLYEQGSILHCYNSLCSCHDNCSVDNPSYHSDGCDVILHSFIHHLARKHWSYLSFSGIRGVFSLLLMTWSSCNFLLSTSSQLLFGHNFPVCALCSAVYYGQLFNTTISNYWDEPERAPH